MSGRREQQGEPDGREDAEAGGRPDFVRRAFLDTDEVVGARWWNDSFAAFHADQGGVGRRASLKLFPWLMFGGIGAAVVGANLCSGGGDDDEPELTFEALELQRREGWNAGHPDKLVQFSSLLRDAKDRADWVTSMGRLVTMLAPDAHLRSLAVPTLFQALAEPANQTLVQSMRPWNPPEADVAFARGQALRQLTEQRDAPPDLAVVVDLPGPQAVAFAAALAPRFCPVFTFDNWPHPLGVVPSHLTLGACLYHLPTFVEAARTRPQPAPALLVLDANRLSPYQDRPDQFDNRYVAPVPSPATWRSLGVKRILYVRPDASSLTELDDLNSDFVAWEREGVSVRALPLTDFSAADLQARAPATSSVAGAPHHHPTYLWGGHGYYHPLFWRHYGYGVGPAPAPRPPRIAPPPPRLSSAPAYRPTFRPTMFASRAIGGAAGVGKQKPSGFGRVSVRMNGAGRVTQVGGWSRGGRSGSFGRSRSSYSG